ncbi:hypothetical protein HN018_12690 [Lichenicola cladoniae]|uniref:Lipocalin-like domain-containing protein n=1 Tax=Lichenicola cladoniae TaxID=1484109 RepID=A0A6M8HR68_9PROT|nr:hypothetical protein [Lichenicola cladoniae]NPD68793.1 hypothetical protein [Acetobacteraceae bacterium]QKE90786.1 hypothetical protein HN018_12690 [Lichenicola cladoniae]
MKTFLSAALMTITALTPLAASAAQLSDYFGHWKVVKIAGYGDASSGQAGADKGLGKSYVISRTSIMMPSGLCDKHEITYDVVTVDGVMSEGWEVTRKDLDLGEFRLGNKAGYINAVCMDGFVLDKNNLLVPSGDGAFYIVRRQT